jgi:hypothetical protein
MTFSDLSPAIFFSAARREIFFEAEFGKRSRKFYRNFSGKFSLTGIASSNPINHPLPVIPPTPPLRESRRRVAVSIARPARNP